MRGLGISELFAFMLRWAVRQSRQTEAEKTATGKLTLVLQSFRSVFEVPTCFCLWLCLALGLQAWLAQSGAPVQLRLGIQRAPGRRIPWEEKVCNSTQGIQLAVGLLAYHVNSQDCFAWVLFWFMPRLFIVKYTNSPGRAPHMQLRALTMGWLCRGQGIATCVCSWERTSHEH